uniref:BTB domain-containing protein n=1 Tax=Panagrolaimus davidi TaxID=227884 RepID=A0A914PDN6_9BILA
MSLYFEERINEQEEDDPEDDMITFIFPWIFELPPLNENNEDRRYICAEEIITSYNVSAFKWHLELRNDTFITYPFYGYLWDQTCNVSYNLYSDNEMQNELYSSPKISAIFDTESAEYCTPNGFLTKFNNAYQKREIAKMVIFVELILPAEIFLRPFDLPMPFLNEDMEYPEDIENDFKFEFLKDSDYSIRCSDGYSMPALKMVLNVSSKFMKKHFKELTENELIVEHKIDVVKPIIIYIHSLCFKMPKSFDIDFADRLLKAIDFFEPEQKEKMDDIINSSLCDKFCKESVNFDLLLQCLQVSIQHQFYHLHKMSCSLIANKYYYKWIDTFPPNACNPGNPLFRDIFGLEGHIDLENEKSLTYETFDLIKKTFVASLFTNVIFQ